MSKIEKLKKRVLNIPRDFTYNEAKTLLNAFGFEEWTKGKTSGSRVRFYRKKDNAIIDLHKPHPGNVMQHYAVKLVVERLKGLGDLREKIFYSIKGIMPGFIIVLKMVCYMES